MTNSKIVVVVPTIREESYRSFLKAWEHLFLKHRVTLVTVWDSECPTVNSHTYGVNPTNSYPTVEYSQTLYSTHKHLVYRYTDACRNLGFIVAAHLKPDYVLTLDDDTSPDLTGCNIEDNDPIQDHLNVLQKRVQLGWMNTAHNTDLMLRGVPYRTRNEAPVMLSHGVWVGTPDFDGETQLFIEKNGGIPYSLPYYVGPIPKGVLFPLCGMNVMVRAEALPYLYFAPMGKDTSIDSLNRFADIWMGISLKKKFDELGWACYTGGSTILHTRASDAKKNFEQEKLGREWNERITDYVNTDYQWRNDLPDEFVRYMNVYRTKREQFANLITSIFLNK